jgi:hypothetical protein
MLNGQNPTESRINDFLLQKSTRSANLFFKPLNSLKTIDAALRHIWREIDDRNKAQLRRSIYSVSQP